MQRRIGMGIATIIATLLAVAAQGTVSTVSKVSADSPTPQPFSPAVLIGGMTGEAGTTNTVETWKIAGTDLGIMWDDGAGKILTAFGDTFGTLYGPGGGGDEWRSNVLLRSSDHNLDDGVGFDSAVVDGTGMAKELIPSRKISGDEMTTIPTAGISVGTRQYMAFMSVRSWGAAGMWDTNYNRIAYSDDDGETWNSVDGPTWQNNAAGVDPFQMVAFEKHGGYVYMFGTPNGRQGAVHLARVIESQILEKAAWTYWNGSEWKSGDDTSAAEIIPAMNSELSVQYNAYTGKWLLSTLDGKDPGTMLLRTADSPTGPWTAGQVIATAADFPGLYGSYLHPWSDGPNLYISMSQWNPYNTFLIRVQLDKQGNIVNPNLIKDSSFERHPTMTSPWHCTGSCGIDTNYAWANSGDRQAWMRENSGTLDIHQSVTLKPHTDYVLSGFVRTGGSVAPGAIGVRQSGPNPQTIATQSFTKLDRYTRFVIPFNSGSASDVEAFVTTYPTSDRWVQIDDFSLMKTSTLANETSSENVEEEKRTATKQLAESGSHMNIAVQIGIGVCFALGTVFLIRRHRRHRRLQ